MNSDHNQLANGQKVTGHKVTILIGQKKKITINIFNLEKSLGQKVTIKIPAKSYKSLILFI